MIRILVYIALLFAAAAGFAWLADRPGEIALTWQGYEVHTSLMVGAVAIAAAFVIVAVVLSILLAVLRAPRLFDGWLSGRRRDRGWRALSRGMIAIGSGDVKRVKRYTAESRKILGNEPLTLLLQAQAAQLAGDAPAARAAFETMLADPETKLLGLRGLYVEAERAGEEKAARHFAEEAAKAAPGLAWAGQALFHYQASAADWHGALKTLGSNLQAKLIERTAAHRLRAVLLTARGLELESSDPEGAKAAALEAVKLAPDLVPAATLAGRLLARQGDIKRASKILEAAWKVEPHPEIAEAYANVRPGDAAGDRLKRARKLAEIRPHSMESEFALARAAIDAKEWGEARRALAAIDASGRTERYCLLMAEIEDGAEGDRGGVREWLSRAVRAPRDPVWTADGYVFASWAAVSPISGRLDVFEWRVPTLSIGDDHRPAIHLELSEPPASPPVMPEPPRTLEAQPAPSTSPSPAVEPAKAVEPSKAAEPTRAAVATAAPAAAAVVAASPTGNGASPVEIELVSPPLPDDPGVGDETSRRLDPVRLQ